MCCLDRESYRLLTDITIISVILVVLGVPGKVLVEVHVEERLFLLGSLVEVGEDHGGASDPVKAAFFHTSCPVVGSILGIDDHQDVLDELVLLLAEDVGEVGPLLRAAVHGRLEVQPGGGEPVAGGVVEVPALLAARVGRHQLPLLQHQLVGQGRKLSSRSKAADCVESDQDGRHCH